MSKRTTARLSGVFILLFGIAVLFGVSRDIVAGQKSLRAKGGPTEVYTQEKHSEIFLLLVGGQFVLGLVALGGGLYLIMRPDKSERRDNRPS